MHISANIHIYVCASDSTYINILAFKSTQIQAHMHTNKIQRKKLTILIDFFKNFHFV